MFIFVRSSFIFFFLFCYLFFELSSWIELYLGVVVIFKTIVEHFFQVLFKILNDGIVFIADSHPEFKSETEERKLFLFLVDSHASHTFFDVRHVAENHVED